MSARHLDIREQRVRLRLSQTRLSSLSKVGRFKICLHERGDQPLCKADLARVEHALRQEARRMAEDLSEIVNARTPSLVRVGAVNTEGD